MSAVKLVEKMGAESADDLVEPSVLVSVPASVEKLVGKSVLKSAEWSVAMLAAVSAVA